MAIKFFNDLTIPGVITDSTLTLGDAFIKWDSANTILRIDGTGAYDGVYIGDPSGDHIAIEGNRDIAIAASAGDAGAYAINNGFGGSVAIQLKASTTFNSILEVPEASGTIALTTDLDGSGGTLSNYLPLAGGTMAGTINSRHIQPDADATYDLGSETLNYRKIYAYDIEVLDELDLGEGAFGRLKGYNGTGAGIIFSGGGNQANMQLHNELAYKGLRIQEGAITPGTRIETSALLELNSTTRAVLLPRIADPSIDVTTPIAGMLAYDSTSNEMQFYDGVDWINPVDGIYTGSGNLKEDTVVSMHDTLSPGNEFKLRFDNILSETVLSMDPTIKSVGIGTDSPLANLNVVGDTAGSVVFKVDGTFGELFTITDNLTGVLFSVNNISGLPVFAVEDTDEIRMGTFSAVSGYTSARNEIIATGDTIIYTADISSYTMIVFEYVVNDGTNLRAGNITAVTDGTTVQSVETITTPSIGNTADITMSVTLDASPAELNLVATTGSTTGWTVKTIVRTI